MRYDCLIVDDEQALGQSACEYLTLFEVKTAWVPGVQECHAFLKENQADLILLDINLGEDSGFTLCKLLREEIDVPILFISARTSDDDILLALGIGGDDYLAKPFSLSVLLAKVQATLKRYRFNVSGDEEFHFGSFSLDYNREKLCRNGQEIKLKTMEFRLLAYLVQNRSRVISKEELFRNVWGDAITGDSTLNVHIRRLREKIEDDPNQPKYIQTSWGTGYMFEVTP